MMKTTRRSLIKGMGGFAAMAAFPFGMRRAVAQASTLTVMTDWSAHGMHAGLFLAAQKKWFEEAGANVKLLDGKGSTATIQQAASGQIDVGFAQLAAMAVARDNGMPLTSIACWVRAGDNGLMVPAGKGYKTLQDLKTKKIAYAAASTTGPFLDAFLTAGGVSRADFNLINVDASALVSTYTSGSVDAAMSTVAFFLPIVQKARPSEGIMWSDVGLRLPGYGAIVLPQTLESKNDALAGFIAAQVKSWEYILAGNVDEAVDAVIAQRPGDRLDPTIIKGQLVAYMKLFDTPATKGKKPGWQSEADWTSALGVMEKASVIKSGWKATDYFTNKYF
jgi:NitT/TauT family transport system substrate-binding protein